MKIKHTLLALAVAASLASCAAHKAQPTKAVATPATQAVEKNQTVEQRELANGLYEMVINPAGDALYVASALSFKDVQGGVVYKLDQMQPVRNIGSSYTPALPSPPVTERKLLAASEFLKIEDGRFANHQPVPNPTPCGET